MSSDNTFTWDPISAGRKLTSNLTINVGTSYVSVSKPITCPHDPKSDAYRACSRCGKHWNYHKDGKCP